ncbi:GH92 family glycosyl hydrolase [Haloferula sargassicola]|uniref:Alpha-1,2-mannosidase n=1 Tax=Haloferula sargassicola TaxID=490096 RepID=A0ABP9UMS4_9BACT
MITKLLLFLPFLATLSPAEPRLVDQVNPFLGTAPVTKVEDIGFKPGFRVWAGLTYPGAALPNAMVQLSPITQFGSGAGYEYEDRTIRAFTHTNKGHWDLCHIPLLPVTGEVDPDDFASGFSHENEHASPGDYRVLLERYGIGVELTVTPRCGLHRYAFPEGAEKKLLLDLGVSNEQVRSWDFTQQGDHSFSGFQEARETVRFSATTSHTIRQVERLKAHDRELVLVSFEDEPGPLELRVGLSFVSEANAAANLEAETKGKSFDELRSAAAATWETLLSRIQVEDGSDRQRRLFYSSLYRSVLWPALRSDANGEYQVNGERRRKKTGYYATPALWDTYRNKLVLLGLLSPEVTGDIIQSMVERGERWGHMENYFHGDHAAAFVAGSYLRGIRNFDREAAYKLLLANAMEESHARPHLREYMENGYIFTPQKMNPGVETKANAGVTKTLEYAYDDYALSLLANEVGDETNAGLLEKRSKNYRHLFDPTTKLMRGRWSNGDWVEPFDPTFPYYEYMYREANAWNSSFFAPHDTQGLIALFGSPEALESQLDRLFSLPWNPEHIAMNINSFIGQYCHGNQPAHGFPYLYHFVGKPEKAQRVIDEAMDRFYGMDGGNTLAGMDDAGEMSAWYVFNAMGFYPYSPADPEYVVTVPVFTKVMLDFPGKPEVTVTKNGGGRAMISAKVGDENLVGWIVREKDLFEKRSMTVTTSEP